MHIKPLKASLFVACGYILLCSIYIWLSSMLAVQLSHSVPVLHKIELYKGLAFVLVTGIIFFSFAYTLFYKIIFQTNELEMQRKALLDSQARALTGTFAAGIAHDINNVLSIVDFSISELQDAVPESKKTNIQRISRAYTMVQDLSTRLGEIGKARTEADMQNIEISKFLQNTIDFAKRHKKLKPCSVSYSSHEEISIKINPFLFEQMIINLLLNAADATKSEGKIEVRLKSIAKQIHIEVHDNGPGISEENRDKVFRAYHTTKADGKGLGLTTVKTCAELHGGSVEINISDLGGAQFRIVLPIEK